MLIPRTRCKWVLLDEMEKRALKQRLRASLDSVLEDMRVNGVLPIDAVPAYQLETPKHAEHGDYSSNVAMVLAKPCRRAPRELADLIVAALAPLDFFERVQVAGPGFINFLIQDKDVFQVLNQIHAEQAAYGKSEMGRGMRIHLEFVSANPTGPLHIGHGRGAAIGSSIANLFEICGFDLCREYYVNDAGRQMDILALSVWLRYLESFGVTAKFPTQAYQGAYIERIAAQIRAERDDAMRVDADALEPGEPQTDPERVLDDQIAAAKRLLGEAHFLEIRELAKNIILAEIKSDLADFGVRFDVWYSEASLSEQGLIDHAIAELEERGHVFDDDGARWFRSSTFGDEKDRVVVRDNGVNTYFAADIAYHQHKFARGFEKVIDIWGADHHGYIPRVKAAMQASSFDPAQLEILLVQFATLFRGGEKVAMSTRAGEFVTLKQLVDEVGVDAARFFYVMRRPDQHLEFDLDLATARSNDNPVYYVQYAHARICSVLRQSRERKLDTVIDAEALDGVLIEPPERAITILLSRYPDVVEAACLSREPHQITQYLRELSTAFHSYYNVHKVLVDDSSLRSARVMLIVAIKQVIANGLDILGISAPSEM